MILKRTTLHFRRSSQWRRTRSSSDYDSRIRYKQSTSKKTTGTSLRNTNQTRVRLE